MPSSLLVLFTALSLFVISLLLSKPVCSLLVFEKLPIYNYRSNRPSCCSNKKAPLLDSLYLHSNGQHRNHMPVKKNTQYSSPKPGKNKQKRQIISSHQDRRGFFESYLHRFSALAILSATTVEPCSAAVERAVGGSEVKCQQLGNCLEKFELDGAVGWSWGAKDRCDPSDPKCGVDGKYLLDDDVPSTPPVPDLLGNQITHIVEIDFLINRKEQGTMRIGLYEEAYPELVRPFLDFFDDRKGLVVSSRLLLADGFYGAFTAPLYFSNGGALSSIYPRLRLDFGVPGQAAAYAKSKGRSKAGDDFVPQPRPNKVKEGSTSNTRNHDCAGLFSVANGGLGYGGSGLESIDQAYASAFQITASAVPSMDLEGRRVVGQVVDDESMAFIQRLASIPTNKGMKGVVPGLNYGPPLIKVSIQDVRVKQATPA